MSRYIVRAAKPLFVETPLWDDCEPMKPHLTVDGSKEIDTGIVTDKGDPIFRVQPPIGFGRD